MELAGKFGRYHALLTGLVDGGSRIRTLERMSRSAVNQWVEHDQLDQWTERAAGVRYHHILHDSEDDEATDTLLVVNS